MYYLRELSEHVSRTLEGQPKNIDATRESFAKEAAGVAVREATALREKEFAAIRQLLDVDDLGLYWAIRVRNLLSEFCTSDKDGNLVYSDGWTDAVVADQLYDDLVSTVSRIRQQSNISSPIKSALTDRWSANDKDAGSGS